MERNPNDNFNQESNRAGGSSGGQYGASGAGGAGGAGGASGGGYGGSTGGGQFGGGESSGAGYGASSGGSQGGFGGGGSQGGYGSTGGYGEGGQGGQGRAEQVRERASEFAGSVSERAGNLKSTLADKLEAGANRLRGQDFGDGSTSGTYGGSQQGSQVTSRVAGGMQATADWLRNAELDQLRTGIERQARENPGRTLLIALGVGYLLGKAFRR